MRAICTILSLFTVVNISLAGDGVIHQVFAGYYNAEPDSVVLKDTTDLPYYSRLEIYRNGKKAFEYTDKYLEIEAVPGRLCSQFDMGCQKSYYIFKVSNRPSIDSYLIIQSDSSKVQVLGKTPASTAEVFGDVDFDGIFEIGGLSDEFDSADTLGPDKQYYLKSLKVFELKNGFPIDSNLTQALLSVILAEKKLK